jgi:hypothetical protein
VSYDLIVRADEEFSKSTAFGPLADFIEMLPNIRPNGSTGFVLDDPPKRWMEIDLEGDFPEEEAMEAIKEGPGRVSSISLQIPYAHLGDAPERDYFPMALAIAKFVGWPLFDAQTGEEIPYAKEEP